MTIGADGTSQYHGIWALTREQERAAFEQFVDFVMARWTEFPDLHIYHYAPYEPSAMKRLMGRFATREEALDRMLRGLLFVDLYQIVRQGIRASVERYSIKELESLFGFVRGTPLEDASGALATLQALLETGDPTAVTENVKAVVLGYNRDDCLSARALRDWLEAVRAELITQGKVLDRPAAPSAEPSEARSAWQIRIDALIARLTADVPDEMRERAPEQQARWILAHVIDWHRREEKAVWWEYFRLSALAPEDLLEEKAGLANLVFFSAAGGTAKAPIHRYRFPPQETELRGGEQLHQRGGDKFGAVERISLEERTIDIKKRKDTAAVHPEAVFTHNVIGTGVLAEALARIGEWVADHGIVGDGDLRAARALLLRERPQLGGEPLRLPGESTLAAGTRIAPKLDGGVLPIQGPPGTGKTHIGARMICALVKSGKKVGITATSHKVIRNLLNAVLEAAAEAGQSVRCIQKVDGDEEDQPPLTFADSNDEVFAALHGSCDVAAGTAWLWARPEALDSVDVLFVDEAAQMSLANVLAVSHAGKTLILLGDPRQLDQPTKGTHPEGTSVSALDYILNGQQTISAEQGLFLSETWRLHPQICAFTSEMFYESRLNSIPGSSGRKSSLAAVFRELGCGMSRLLIGAIKARRLKRRMRFATSWPVSWNRPRRGLIATVRSIPSASTTS